VGRNFVSSYTGPRFTSRGKREITGESGGTKRNKGPGAYLTKENAMDSRTISKGCWGCEKNCRPAPGLGEVVWGWPDWVYF